MICNYISALPRCQQEPASRSHQSGPGLVAKLTQQRLELEVEVGQLGYLASPQYTSGANTVIFNMVMGLLLTFTTTIYL